MTTPDTPVPKPIRRPARGTRRAVAGVLTLAVVAGGLYGLKGTGLRTRLFGGRASHSPPTPVSFVWGMPADADTGVPVDTTIVTRVRPTHALDAATVTTASVRLVRVPDQSPVAADVALTDPQTIRLTPRRPLDARTQYAVYVGRDVKTTRGVPVVDAMKSFTTAGPADPDLRFERTALPTSAGNAYTCVVFGPDGAVWAASVDGRVFRFPVLGDGTLATPAVFDGLQAAERGPRLLTGFCFDPHAPADAPVLIAAHSCFGFENVPDFTGKISRLSGPGLTRVDDLVVNLPRSANDHATNQPAVGPDGCVYFPQPSNSASGAPDAFWGMRAEHRLNATVLRLDLARLTPGRPLDARTADCGGRYDPLAADAPLTVYADGVRLAFDLLWHRNGRLYAPVNGASAGGNTPADPARPGTALTNLATAQNDWLLDVRPGRFYGQPNPAAGHYVLNGGRPTAAFTFGEVPEYPLGTPPDPAYTPPLLCLGQHQSANGLIEYRGRACHGKLDGRILVCRYARGGDVLVLTLDAAGTVVDQQFGLPGLSELNHPLDLTQNPATGDLYLSEFGARCLTLVRPL